MKCKICEHFFVKETTFRNLYSFPEICDKCLELYRPILQLEKIPYDQGLLTYYYLYDELKLNIKQRSYLDKYWEILYDLMNKLSPRNATIIIVDEDFIKLFKEEFTYIKGFSSIIFMSLIRYNFENLMIFF